MNRFFTAKRMALILTLTIMSLLVAACAGDPGADGLSGSVGAAGSEGAAGAAGAGGAAGTRGAAGADGAAGAGGAAGARGSAGPAGAFGADGESTTAGVTLSANSVASGTGADVSVWLTGFGSTESITVTLVAPDGSTSTQSATAASGLAIVTISPALLARGLHGVIAEGNAGSKASAALNIK